MDNLTVWLPTAASHKWHKHVDKEIQQPLFPFLLLSISTMSWWYYNKNTKFAAWSQIIIRWKFTNCKKTIASLFAIWLVDTTKSHDNVAVLFQLVPSLENALCQFLSHINFCVFQVPTVYRKLLKTCKNIFIKWRFCDQNHEVMHEPMETM